MQMAISVKKDFVIFVIKKDFRNYGIAPVETRR